MSYLICHMKKFHKPDISPIEKEIERDENYKSKNPQIDSSRTKDNYHIIKRELSYMEYINARIESCNMKTKPRKDAVLMNSFVIGSDTKFFPKYTTRTAKGVFYRQCEFFCR